EFKVVTVPADPRAVRAAVEVVTPLLSEWRDAVVLVDLAFKADPVPDAVYRGRKLALDLKDQWPGVQVGVYSRYPVTPEFSVELSTDNFAVVLPDMRRLCDGPDQAPGTWWVDVLSRAVAPLPSAMASAAESDVVVRWDRGQPLFRS